MTLNESVIIVTFNSETSIIRLVKTLKKNSVNFKEIIFIDNGSSDNTLRILKKEFRKSTKIALKVNYGFARAVNLGIISSLAEYILIINPDTIIGKNCISVLARELSNHKDAAAITCRVLNPDGTVQPTCGKFPTLLNIVCDRVPIINKWLKTEIIRNHNYYELEQHPDWISGACMLIRKSAIEQVGLFDERYFMYVEDVDWCYRARQAGWDILYTPKTSIVHFNEGSSPARRKGKFINMRKGFILFFTKYRTKWEFWLLKLLFWLEGLIVKV